MKAQIRPYKADAEFYTAELCFINELSNSDSDQHVSIARARVKPGVTTHWHRLHGITERYVILEGNGCVEIEGLVPRIIGPNDVVLIPPEYRQRIKNSGDDDLIFLAICTPRFRQEAYEDVEILNESNL